ncbi:hypothetical protein BJY04DRAFT_215635 [Aspergillus karnatakaensis]|uniref:uncharacterized protein n=1 Tax=Aspergillus karnatakaensis TaxID=1810916 RepID=UPI003CCCBDE7
MGYDGDVKAIVEQDQQIMVPGLSDEAGAGAYVAAAIKQAFQPNAEEIAQLEEFVDEVLFKKRSDINWNRTPGKDVADEINRAYNYVWPAACYWSLYRVGRAYPHLLKTHDWQWYLALAYRTVVRGMQSDIGYNTEGLMGETVFGEILTNLRRENMTEDAEKLEGAMRKRVDEWRNQQYPFGSEQSWDSTGQEGVYFWARYFQEAGMVSRAKNSVLGYMPTVPHWGYDGNARRYWDFTVGGMLKLIERQIHHYGSGLNALVMLSAFRDDPSDSYLLRVGYAGTSGPLANIQKDGFASCAMHAWPEHLFWDGYSGDYGPNFVGLALGSGTYLVEDAEVGPVVYGGVAKIRGHLITVQVRDPLRQKTFVAPLGLEVRVDAGVIEEFTYNLRTRKLSLTLGQRENGPKAEAAIVWVSTVADLTESEGFRVIRDDVGVGLERGGRKVALKSQWKVNITIEQV